jgi:predicted kinase
MKLTLIILRGLPGSGKTTLAELLSENKWPVFSIDDYFTDPLTKKYSFDFSKNHLAYKACQDKTEEAMQTGTEKIFLHNTFTLEWEMEPYFILAEKYQYKLHILTVENRHHSKNKHDIPQEQIQKMAEKYKVVLL